jgi:NAD+ synthase
MHRHEGDRAVGGSRLGPASHEIDDPLAVDLDNAIEELAARTAAAVRGLGRRGAVVAVSGGVDSGVVAALCVRAFGPAHVLCLRLPERDIGGEASDLGLELARSLGAPTVEEPITAALDALGCYRRRDEAIRMVFPDYEPGWRHKLVRSAPSGALIVFSLVVERPDGSMERRKLPADAYRALISTTNMKQRVRKLLEYTWADRLGYAVIGTPNLLEYDQGFFVKGGDGLADVKPIARLYKTQVYALAQALGLPEAIATRPPTTETFSLPQTQEEFYFGHPHERMDLLVWGRDRGLAAEELAPRVGLDADAVTAAFWEIDRRRVATRYLHAPPVIVDAGSEAPSGAGVDGEAPPGGTSRAPATGSETATGEAKRAEAGA